MINLVSLIIYVMVFLFSSLMMYLYQKSEIKYKAQLIFIIVIGILTCFSGFRYYVGTDYRAYLIKYYTNFSISIIDFITSLETEWGFYLLTKIANITGNYRVLFLSAAFITVTFACLAIKEHGEKLSMGLALLVFTCIYYPISFNIMRQVIAVVIVLYAYRYIFQRNLRKFIGFVLVATTFHITAIVVLPFYFIEGEISAESEREKRKKQILKVLVVVFTYIFIVYFQYIILLLSNISVLEKYLIYTSTKVVGENREIYLKALVLVVIIIFRKRLINHDKRNSMYVFFLIIDLLLNLTGYVNPYVKRISLYFGIVQILLLPSFLNSFKITTNKIIIGIGIILYALGYFVLVFYILGQSSIFPYRINVF